MRYMYIYFLLIVSSAVMTNSMAIENLIHSSNTDSDLINSYINELKIAYINAKFQFQLQKTQSTNQIRVVKNSSVSPVDKKGVLCATCLQRYSNIPNMKSHAENKHFICRICNKKCENHIDLNNHSRYQHSRPTFYIVPCGACNIEFQDKNKKRINKRIKMHYSQRHPNLTPPQN